VTLAAAAAAVTASADVNTPVDTGGLRSLSGYYLAARHADRERDLQAAADYYRSALLGDKDNPELLAQTVTLTVAAGDIESAATRAGELLEREPDNRVALATIAVEAFGRGDHERAETTLKRLGGGGPFPQLLGALIESWVLAERGETEAALEMLDSLDGPSWFSPFVPFHAGLIADLAGMHDVAVERMSAVYEPGGTEFRLMIALARALARGDRTDEALNILSAYDKEVGTDANTKALREEIESGQPIAPYAGDARAGAAEALFDIGTAIASTDNNFVESAGYMRLALHLDPTSPFAALSLGTTLTRLGQNEDAVQVFGGVPEDAVTYPESVVQTALNLNQLERVDEAVELLSERLKTHPDDVDAGVNLGNILRGHERFDEAAEIYTTLIERLGEVPPAFWSLYYYRGITYEQTKRWPLAEQDFRKALELEPDQPLVLNYLGYSLIDRGEKLDEAVSMVEKAVEQRPDDGYIVDSLGWAYYRLGNYERAVKELERAVSLRPEDPVINDHLGEAYWKVGRKLEATFQWSHARDLNPDADDLETILTKLREGLDGVESERDAAAAAAASVEDAASD
jgi:tetratricopeptide (TPR) repeat protein